MLIVHIILACVAVGALAGAPRGPRATAAIALAGALDWILGAPLGPAVTVVAPLVAFLAAALTLAAIVQRSGLVDRVAAAMLTAARGSGLALYGLVCALCGALTATISLDGAVVVMVPVVLAVSRRAAAPFAPLFLGSVVVANAASIAVPQGNPTNLLIISRLNLSAGAFLGRMLVPGLVAAVVCAAGVAVAERSALARPLRAGGAGAGPLSTAERHAALALVFSAAVAWSAPLLGIAPWWPFAAAVLVAFALTPRRPRVVVPWRLAVQITALLIVTQAFGLIAHVPPQLGILGLLGVAAAVAIAAALINNLPVSVWVTGLLTAGAPAYAASVGLAVGSLATPHGSVATLIATDLAGVSGPGLPVRRFAPLAVAGVLTATLALWLIG